MEPGHRREHITRALGRLASTADRNRPPARHTQLLSAAEGAYPQWQVFFLVMARAGLRVGECLALQPDDLDLARGTLWVRRTFIQAQLGHASIPITVDVYGHLRPGSFAKLVNALDAPTGRNPGATTPAATEELSQ